ncbi:MAG: proline/glycine betaine ABC transporter substrate-binding protein ProX [Trueperaceae bacterium]|nr:MAG: proline/glycine betaine ABC transporter substrate-binding protein ProX [Trueperaceae bacterium]
MHKRILTLALAASLAVVGVANAGGHNPGEGVTVTPAVAGWDDARPVQAIFDLILGELGYDVQRPVLLDNPIFYTAVTQGDVDFWTAGWFPLHNTHLPSGFEANASIVGTIAEAGGTQGYLVTKSAAEEFGITSLEDFKRPEVKEAFDRTGDGKADLVACPPGWGCETVIEHHLDVYDLRDHINDIKASYNAAFADALAAYNAGEPVLYYTWTPNFTVFQMVPGEDSVWINVPEIAPNADQEGFEDGMVVSGLEGAVSDPVMLGFVADDIRAVANNDFLEANPAAATILELVEISVVDISEMVVRIDEGESSDADVMAMAAEWIEANRATVDDWLDAARAAAN